MKIISKHKEYYDYLQGKFGIDDKVVYDRRTTNLVKPSKYHKHPYNSDSVSIYKFAICGKFRVVFKFRDELYHTIDELKDLEILLLAENIRLPFDAFYYRDFNKYWDYINGPTDLNIKERQPVLVTKDRDNLGVPSLSDFGFPKWIPAEDMFKDIYAFQSYLNDHPEIPNKQTDKEKLVSHGFDSKISFRHRKA